MCAKYFFHMSCVIKPPNLSWQDKYQDAEQWNVEQARYARGAHLLPGRQHTLFFKRLVYLSEMYKCIYQRFSNFFQVGTTFIKRGAQGVVGET
jgi:hypothetical protein